MAFAKISGKVSDQFNNPLKGVSVNCGWGLAKTDENGKYGISGLCSGRHTATFTKKDYGRIQMAVTINPGANILNVTMVFELGTLSGKVTDSVSNAGLPGVAIAMTGQGGNANTITDSTGNFGITGITPGSYSFTFTKTGYVTVTR
ncbi:MAG: carboxypeptidase-like regulatory domain-containing protein [Dehalococcoidales bacterium]|nr:carboxypeptidase-like regulatory domain-containing protein [Dehalococcoidales bacterium]